MRRLWREIGSHPLSVLWFAAYWLATWAVTYLTWQQPAGMAPAAVVLHFLAPFLAGAVVGWWRAPPREEPPNARGEYTGGALAAACVMVVSVALIFVPDAWQDLRHGGLKWAGVGKWLVWSIAAAAIAVVLGLIGTQVGVAAARSVRVRPAKQ